ncbi:hypothetical protein GGR57DRAFT_494097 [Xylariaceae sp. FL1272]|nr:hypothetical protein GGR57DRAFT_494097 [Xylariaceae sp. FL1272]
MPNPKAHMRSSRRIPPLKDYEIDHEIRLIDDDAVNASQKARPLSVYTVQSRDPSSGEQPLVQSDSRAPLTENAAENGKISNEDEPTDGSSARHAPNGQPPDEIDAPLDPLDTSAATPEDALRDTRRISASTQRHPPSPKEVETAIDILYENQRGGFLCGIPLFSSAALGNLDPSPWTNFAHHTSPTDIHNAQVPDPSWEWAWPEWRINHDEQIQTDSEGWEYSFMFSKKFSWHGPRWYNSYVRRRAWIRRRIKKGLGYQAIDEHMMNKAYFTVVAKTLKPNALKDVDEADGISVDRRSRMSGNGSRKSRDRSRGPEDDVPVAIELKTAEALMTTLRRSLIDREKLEAVENYIENCTDDLLQLQESMHEIMSVFVFQASRRLLLARLTQLHDDIAGKAGKGKGKGDSIATRKAQHLAEAIKHADEEVRRLEYWSDIKAMAEEGEAPGAVDKGKGWDSSWQGLDKSGAKGIKEDDLPGPE